MRRNERGSLGFRVARFVGAGLRARPRASRRGDHGRRVAQGIAPTSTSSREVLETHESLMQRGNQ
jgi:hypothetical protein